jgi:hypothetical protein
MLNPAPPAAHNKQGANRIKRDVFRSCHEMRLRSLCNFEETFARARTAVPRNTLWSIRVEIDQIESRGISLGLNF